MKVSQVTIFTKPGSRFNDIFVREGADGITDLHYITRDGTAGVNYVKDGKRRGSSFPLYEISGIETVL